MRAEARPTIALTNIRANHPPPAFTQLRLWAPSKRSRLGHIFPEEIVICMIDGRRPARHEVDAVAAKIWNDIQAGEARIRWRDVVPGSKAHQRMTAAARAALGDLPKR